MKLNKTRYAYVQLFRLKGEVKLEALGLNPNSVIC